MNTIIDDFKNAWQRPNNGLMQLIIINIVVFVTLGVLAVISSIIGADSLFTLPIALAICGISS